MQLKTIEIINYKGIEYLEIDFDKKFNLIIGDNGVGKSSILDAIAIALSGYLAGVDQVYGINIKNHEVRFVTTTRGDASYSTEYKIPVEIACTVALENSLYSWTRRKKSLMASRTTLEPKDIKQRTKEIINDRNSILPVLVYQGAARMWLDRRLPTNEPNKNASSRYMGYVNCLNSHANTKDLINWCRKMEQISWQEDKKISEYEAVKSAVSKFMRIMNTSSKLSVFYDKKSDELNYRDESGTFPISMLSAGYQSLIWMVFDVAYRMAVLNPDLRHEVINLTPGIILIDEIDVHLHPQWQWKIIEALEQTFPKIQIIATTHSPIILTSAKDKEIIILRSNNKVDYKSSSYALPIENVLKGYQDSSDLPKEIKNKFDQFGRELDAGRLDRAEKTLSSLKNVLDESNPRIVEATVELDFEKTDLE